MIYGSKFTLKSIWTCDIFLNEILPTADGSELGCFVDVDLEFAGTEKKRINIISITSWLQKSWQNVFHWLCEKNIATYSKTYK